MNVRNYGDAAGDIWSQPNHTKTFTMKDGRVLTATVTAVNMSPEDKEKYGPNCSGWFYNINIVGDTRGKTTNQSFDDIVVEHYR